MHDRLIRNSGKEKEYDKCQALVTKLLHLGNKSNSQGVRLYYGPNYIHDDLLNLVWQKWLHQSVLNNCHQVSSLQETRWYILTTATAKASPQKITTEVLHKSRIDEGFYSLYSIGIHRVHRNIEGIRYFTIIILFYKNVYCKAESRCTLRNNVVRHGSLFAPPLG